MSKLRSPDYGRLCRGKLLDDQRIDYYRLRGRYGPEQQAMAEAERKARRPKSTRKKKTLSAAEQVTQQLLDEI